MNWPVKLHHNPQDAFPALFGLMATQTLDRMMWKWALASALPHIPPSASISGPGGNLGPCLGISRYYHWRWRRGHCGCCYFIRYCR